jgi:hypothetical protein
VRLEHALDHAVAAKADEVVDERHEYGRVLKMYQKYSAKIGFQ